MFAYINIYLLMNMNNQQIDITPVLYILIMVTVFALLLGKWRIQACKRDECWIVWRCKHVRKSGEHQTCEQAFRGNQGIQASFCDGEDAKRSHLGVSGPLRFERGPLCGWKFNVDDSLSRRSSRCSAGVSWDGNPMFPGR